MFQSPDDLLTITGSVVTSFGERYVVDLGSRKTEPTEKNPCLV